MDKQTINESQVANEPPVSSQRIKSIDRFRGLAVFLMITYQFLRQFHSLGFISRLTVHGTNGIHILFGLNIADLGAPNFLFAIALTYALSFKKREKEMGTKKAYIHYAARSLSLIGVGGILYSVDKFLDLVRYNINLRVVDYIGFSFGILSILVLILIFINYIPAVKKKLKKLPTQILYIILSAAGVFILTVALIDFIHLNQNAFCFTYGYWVTLQYIGLACLVALPFIKLNKWWKLLAGVIIFTGYAIYHQTGNSIIILQMVVHSGFLGGFQRGAMLLFGMFIADIYHEKKFYFLIPTFAFLGLGIASYYLLGPASFSSCSPTYALLTVATSALIFSTFELSDKLPHSKFDLMLWWGKNPLVMFIIEFLFIKKALSFLPPSFRYEAPLWLAALQWILMTVLMTFVAWLLSKRKKSISL